MNETEKLIEEQWKILPLDLQRAIKSVPWKTLVQDIGKTSALDAEQIASLEQETMLIIYAFEPPDDYIENIGREVGVSEDAASSIAESVTSKVFEPILKKSEEFGKETVSSSVPELAPEIHPMVEEGEEAHNVKHVEPAIDDSLPTTENQKPPTDEQPKKDRVDLPDYRYPGGNDPYREPLV